jgi:hypothetical protein
MNDFLNSLGNSWLAEWTRSGFWPWPLLETLHFIGLCGVVGALLTLDLRVIGWGKPKNLPLKPVLGLIPFTIVAFSINLLTGIALFCGDPFRYYVNFAFQWKIALIVIAGINALWFWFGEHDKLSKLPQDADTPMGAKVIAGLSLLLWTGVIILGRLIPYFD